jgi:hypothetical protein
MVTSRVRRTLAVDCLFSGAAAIARNVGGQGESDECGKVAKVEIPSLEVRKEWQAAIEKRQQNRASRKQFLLPDGDQHLEHMQGRASKGKSECGRERENRAM